MRKHKEKLDPALLMTCFARLGEFYCCRQSEK